MEQTPILLPLFLRTILPQNCNASIYGMVKKPKKFAKNILLQNCNTSN